MFLLSNNHRKLQWVTLCLALFFIKKIGADQVLNVLKALTKLG